MPTSGPWLGLAAGAALLLVAARADAACDAGGADAADVAGGRAAVAASCDCATAASHAAYVRCALDAAKGTVVNPACRRVVARCAHASTCGRPGAVVCCLTDERERTRGRVKRDPGACRSSPPARACVAEASSICDGCDAEGCVPTTTTSTTSTTLPARCGNGIVEPGEFCDGDFICQEVSAVCASNCAGCCTVGFCSDFQFPGGPGIPCCSGAPCIFPHPTIPGVGACAY
jgi:hypothetical protein